MLKRLRILLLLVSVVVLLPNAIFAATITDSICGTKEFPPILSPLGGTVEAVLNCAVAGHPNMDSRGVLIESVDHSLHVHRGLWTQADTPDTQTIESPAPWSAQGARLEVGLKGFISFQGNPGDIVQASATLIGSFDGLFARADLPLTTVTSGQRVFGPGIGCPSCFAFDQVLTGHPQGPHLSTLTVRLTGPGEFHLTGSGTSEVTPIPEPSTLILLATGFMGVVLSLGRRKRA